MLKLGQALLYLALAAILFLAACSVVGAFAGAEQATVIFNSWPLAAFWVGFAVILVLGVVYFPTLRKRPALLLCHLGCILILVGGLWGSRKVHGLVSRFGPGPEIYKGKVAVVEGETQNEVFLAPDYEDTAELPFSVRLNDFRIEYYQPGKVMVESRGGGSWQLPAEAGAEYRLANGDTLEVVQVYRNFKISLEDGEVVPRDAEGPGENPAVEVVIRSAEGGENRKYAFESFPGHVRPEDQYVLRYYRPVKDYISKVEILVDGKVVRGAEVEVNHPLHVQGYHLYQDSYRQIGDGQYASIFSVVSDQGLYFVWAGYGALVIGIVWQMWFVRLRSAVRNRQEGRYGN